MVALILAAMVFVGRTGFVLVAVFTVFLLLFGQQRGRVVVGFLAAILLFLAGVWLTSIIIEEDRLAQMFSQAIASAFEAFTGIGDGDGLRTASTDDLWSMIVVPDSLSGWLIGDGFYSSPVDPNGNYMGTDIGYLRLLLYVGVLGSLAIYTWYLSMAAWSSRVFQRHQDRMFCGGLICCFFVSQIKFGFLLLSAPLGFTLLLGFAAVREPIRCA